jgi:acyl-coenzyme A synthetase/AMP-(fatty) acid ligase
VAPGATVEVLDASGARCRPGETGALRVRLEGMPHAYWGPDAGDRSRFREGWFHPGDRGRVTPEGLLHVEGRADDIVNIGGRKAEPAYLERALEGHAHVEQAAVFALPDGDGAPALAAAIVPRPGLSWPALHAFALARLSTLAPTRYYEAAALPRGEMGKLARASLAARFAPCEPAFAARLFEVAP